MGKDFRDMLTDYGIQKKPITVRNPQANAIIERVHQTIGDMIRSMQLNGVQLLPDNPWGGVLSATAFAVRSTVHSTTGATPEQLVF